MTFKDLKKRVGLEVAHRQSKLFERLQNKPFWIWDKQQHKQEDISISKNGTELVDLINPYAVVNTQQVYPTGPVNGLLTSGEIRYGIRGPSSDVVFTYGGLLGPLIDKPVTALNDVIKNNSAYVTVRTLDHQTGEIQGQIVPTSSTVSCLTHARFGVPTTTPNVNNSLY